MSEPERVRFSYAEGLDGRFRRSAVRAIERVSGQQRLKRLYDRYRATAEPQASFWEEAVRHLALDVRVGEGELDALPRSGPLVVLANHPFGVLDGIVLCWLVSRRRSDFKVLVHGALSAAPEVRPYLLPIDFSPTREAQAANVATRARAISLLQAGGCIIVFPAGGVSTTAGPFARRAEDAPWGAFTAKLIQQARATVVPVYFAGQNSRLFQVASHISLTVRLALLFRETARRIGTSVPVRIGHPVAAEEWAGAPSREAMMRMLRERTYALGRTPQARRRGTSASVLAAMLSARHKVASKGRRLSHIARFKLPPRRSSGRDRAGWSGGDSEFQGRG